MALVVLGCSWSALTNRDEASLTATSAIRTMGVHDAEQLWVWEESCRGNPPQPGVIVRKAESPRTWNRMLAALEGAVSVEVCPVQIARPKPTHVVQFTFGAGPIFPLYYWLESNELIAEGRLLLGPVISGTPFHLLTREQIAMLNSMAGKYVVFKMPEDFSKLLEEIVTATGKLP